MPGSLTAVAAETQPQDPGRKWCQLRLRELQGGMEWSEFRLRVRMEFVPGCEEGSGRVSEREFA